MKFTDRLRALIQSAENGLSAPAEKALMEFMSDHAKEILALVDAAEKIAPYTDTLICYASTIDEFPLNGAVKDFNESLAALEKEQS